MAEMKRLGHIVAVLAFAFALLMGAAGGAVAHAGPADHHGSGHGSRHGSHHAPADPVPAQGDSHKVALTVVAPCCPAAEAPARHIVSVTVTTVRVSWNPRPEPVPAVRAITPDTPPPKTTL
ncbi:MAG TPA: hypothetical protein VGE72_14740 [Azospirillum sp.]